MTENTLSPVVLEVLSSKICHDLISPVGAIHNGIELVEDMGPEAYEDAFALIAQSVQQANKRLKMFRFAYGSAGSRQNVDARDIRKICFEAFESGRTSLEWAETDVTQAMVDHRGLLKGIVSAIMLAAELVKREGTVQIAPTDTGASVTLHTKEVTFKDGQVAALEGTIDPEDLTPELVHAYVTGQLARLYDVRISPAIPESNKLVITVEPK